MSSFSTWGSPYRVQLFDAAGPVTDAKVWFGTATTNASGQWSVDYSAAGFSAPPAVQATCVGLGLTAADVRNADITSRTA